MRGSVVVGSAILCLVAAVGCSGGAARETVELRPAQPATAAQLSAAAGVLTQRLRSAGVSGSVRVVDGRIDLTVPRDLRGGVGPLVAPGDLSFREIATDPASGSPAEAANPTGTVSSSYAATQAAAERACVQSLPTGSTDQTGPASCTLATFATLDCSQAGGAPLDVDPDPHHDVLACDRSGKVKYVLGPTDIPGSAVQSATATLGQTAQGASTGQWQIDVTFRESSLATVTAVSTRLYQDDMQQLAITLDGVVESAPETNAVLGRDIEISGGSSSPFTEASARQLAAAMTEVPLPIALTVSTGS